MESLEDHPVLLLQHPWGSAAGLRELLYPLFDGNPRFPSRFLTESESGPAAPGGSLCLDGSLLLQRFFKTVHSPRDPHEILVVHEKHRSLVTDAWGPQTVFFALVADGDEAPSKVDSIFVNGVFYPTVNDQKDIARRIDGLNAYLESVSLPKETPKYLVFSFRDSPWLHEQPSEFANQILELVFRQLGPYVYPFNWSQLTNRSSLDGSAFFDLNDQRLCSVSAFQLLALSRGGAALAPELQNIKQVDSESIETFRVPISRYFHISFQIPNPGNAGIKELFRRTWLRDFPLSLDSSILATPKTQAAQTLSPALPGSDFC